MAAEGSKVVAPIEEQIIAFLEAHGFRDFAFVLINPQGGAVRSRWLAGDGEDQVADRKRGGDLHFELEILQAQILNHQLGLAAPRPAATPPSPKAKPRKSPKPKRAR